MTLSSRIVCWLASARFLRALAMLCLFTLLLWRSVIWALQPGWWVGSFLGGGTGSALEEARRHFGPVLLVTWWIRESPEAWHGLDREEVLHGWGMAESTARLLLILGVLFVLLCALTLRHNWTGAQQVAAPNSRPPSPLPLSPETQMPDSLRAPSSGGGG
jgi:hypothetical protein